MDLQQINFNNCDDEPIHIPGSIQPHGVLLVLNESDLSILQVSQNTLNIFGIPPEELINKNLDILLDKTQINDLKRALVYEDLQKINPINLSISLANKTNIFDGIIHRRDEVLILELEPNISNHVNGFLSFYHLVRLSASKIQSAFNLQNLSEIIVKEIRQLSGFDRVMVYQFDLEKNGIVIAEDKQEYLPSWLGLHYPQSDIPKQARRLYSVNMLRLIADVNYQPVAIIPQDNPITKQPLDLSFSVLRSVSPMHIEYLQNMGVGASMSISLMKEQKLWGLIACHHQSPKYVAYEIRKACEFLGQVMSLELSFKEGHEDLDYQIKLKSVNQKLIEYMSREENFIEGLIKYDLNLLDLTKSTGAAICLNGNWMVVGKTPQEEHLKKIVEWITNNIQDNIFYTDSLAKIYQEAEAFKELASGLLAISISQNQKNYIIWFRPEVMQTVNWAGNPEKLFEISNDGEVRMSPRKSFELWKESVKLKCLPWQKCEVEAAIELRNAIINIVLRKTEELALLNIALQESEIREREKSTQLEITLHQLQRTQNQIIQQEKMSSLGQMVAGLAYEINNPVNFIYGNLTHADNYTQDLIALINLYTKYYPEPVPEIQKESKIRDLEFVIEDLPRLLKSMNLGVEKIRDLVQSLRNFTRVDEAEMKSVNIHNGLDSTLLILSNRLKTKSNHLGIKIIKNYGNLPNIECYAALMNQVFMNILSKMIDRLNKYNAQRTIAEIQATPATIAIYTEVVNREEKVIANQPGSVNNDQSAITPHSSLIIRLTDNGPEISGSERSQIFNPFLGVKPEMGAIDLGLAISYEIVVEKHGGILQCLSEQGKGVEFLIEIPLGA